MTHKVLVRLEEGSDWKEIHRGSLDECEEFESNYMIDNDDNVCEWFSVSVVEVEDQDINPSRQLTSRDFSNLRQAVLSYYTDLIIQSLSLDADLVGMYIKEQNDLLNKLREEVK